MPRADPVSPAVPRAALCLPLHLHGTLSRCRCTSVDSGAAAVRSAGAGVPASFGAGTGADSGSGGSSDDYTGVVAAAIYTGAAADSLSS